jgi:hypothetical protein
LATQQCLEPNQAAFGKILSKPCIDWTRYEHTGIPGMSHCVDQGLLPRMQ